MLLVFSSISVFSQKVLKVVSFKQSTSDISARTSLREDPTGEACALVKVQLPIRNVMFDGDIIGEIAYKINEYWVYMPQNSSQLEIKIEDYRSLIVDFSRFNIPALEAKGTYELCVIEEERGSTQLYNEGMIALSQNDIITAFEKLEKAYEAGFAPAAFQLGRASLVSFDRVYDEDPNSIESYQQTYNYYKKAADKGYPKAQSTLGIMLLDGEFNGVKIDNCFLEKSNIWNLIRDAADKGDHNAQYRMISDKEWVEKSATKGIAIAEFGMGLRFDDELFVEEYPMLESLEINRSQDYRTAFNWYQKAASHGLDIAQWRLGEMYARGMGVEKNMSKAIEWRIKAAEQGNYLFQFLMGYMYSFGVFTDYSTCFYSDGYNYEIDVPVDIKKADYWMGKFNHKELSKLEKERIEGNNLYSSTIDNLAEQLITIKDYYKAIYWYQRKIDLGYFDGYCYLGVMYLNGTGFSQDYNKARIAFEKSLIEDDNDKSQYEMKSDALCYLGRIYRLGLGVEKDIKKSKDYYMKSLDNDYGSLHIHNMTNYELGELYYDQSNIENAVKYYSDAAFNFSEETKEDIIVDLNEYSTLAYYKLGTIYLNGMGIEKDEQKGVEYLNEAASRGNNNAIQKLKNMKLPIPDLIIGKSRSELIKKKYNLN